MARVSETNQQDRGGSGAPGPGRQPRIAMLIRRNGTWREVAFERRPYPAARAVAAIAAPEED